MGDSAPIRTLSTVTPAGPAPGRLPRSRQTLRSSGWERRPTVRSYVRPTPVLWSGSSRPWVSSAARGSSRSPTAKTPPGRWRGAWAMRPRCSASSLASTRAIGPLRPSGGRLLRTTRRSSARQDSRRRASASRARESPATAPRPMRSSRTPCGPSGTRVRRWWILRTSPTLGSTTTTSSKCCCSSSSRT